MPKTVTSLSLGPTSDLVVTAKWRPDLIEADEPILPRNRLALTFKAIFELRRRSREATEIAVFADPIERLEQIHSFRFAAEPDAMRLSVTYDFGWETYMRALWRDAGPFLDLLCCHCEGYPLARDAQLPDWRAWILNNQSQSAYFYSATALTVGDLAALSQSERVQRDAADGAAADRLVAGFSSRSASVIAQANRRRFPEEAVRQASAAIAIMYRLTRYWTADISSAGPLRDDAMTLLLATRGLIEGSFATPGSFPPQIETALRTELSWYRQEMEKRETATSDNEVDRTNIQKGILTPYDAEKAPMTHGAVVFLAITDKDHARQSLAALAPAAEQGETPRDGIYRNLAFTFRGLGRIGKSPDILAAAPTAFRDGAAARAGLVGDVRGFHPSKWRPLRRNWEPNPDETVELFRVDALVQLRISAKGAPTDLADRHHPLRQAIDDLARPGLAILAVEGLVRADVDDPDRDHLGFRDGLSQPRLDGPDTKPWSDKVEPGALLAGRGDGLADEFWRDGSFLAVRRMTIDRPRFDALLYSDARPALRDRELVAAKLLGRMPDGTPLAPAYGENNFVYEGDETGEVCPLHSHVRRANPRRGNPPRIMRRGMSFGPPIREKGGGDRGTMFMAYCGDLAEQYERVLGWVNGGNSVRTGSYLADPLIGGAELDATRTFRFLHAGEVHRLALPEAARGFVGLSWSLYLFAPSLAAIRALGEPETSTRDPADAQVEEGRKLIKAMRTAGKAAWRALLNEPASRDSGRPQALWAAVRAGGGILETPAGFLVGSHALVMDVLRDDGGRFSNSGAGKRMKDTIGPFHLGMDPKTDDYQRLSTPANAALRSVTEAMAFEPARKAAREAIEEALSTSTGGSGSLVDLLKDLIEPVLGKVGKAYFGIPDDVNVAKGSQNWRPVDTRKPCFPGDFWSPSRNAFNPFESGETTRLAKAHGEAAVRAVTAQIGAVGRNNLTGAVSREMAAATKAYPTDEDLARVLVGSLIGAVPTIAGNAIRLLLGAIASGDMAQLQSAWRRMDADQRTFAAAKALFSPAVNGVLQKTPVPEMLWRLVAKDNTPLGKLTLKAGDTLIFSLESAGRDQDAHKERDAYIAFGMARPGDGAQPAHGCPGREMALGAMLGLTIGLIETARFRPASGSFAELWRL